MGEVFAGHYELVDLVATGSKGAVWRAWDHRQQTYVSATVMRQHDAVGLVRFTREHSASLQHPHVLLPRAWAGSEEYVLFAADLVRGGSAAELIAEWGPLPDFLAAQVIEQLLSALSAVHDRGFVHRDIRASKLLLEPTGAQRPHCWLGGFAAVAVGEPSDDLHRVGQVAAELVTGQRVDPTSVPDPGPAQLSASLWSWILQLAAGSLTSAEQARTELLRIGVIPQQWPSSELRIEDRLGELPAGWAPDGPGPDSSVPAGETAVPIHAADAGTAASYEEIPALPHVVPPVPGDLSDEDVSDDDGFGELADLVPSDPAYADSAVVSRHEASGDEPDQWGEPEPVEPAQLSDRSGLVPPEEPDESDDVVDTAGLALSPDPAEATAEHEAPVDAASPSLADTADGQDPDGAAGPEDASDRRGAVDALVNEPLPYKPREVPGHPDYAHGGTDDPRGNGDSAGQDDQGRDDQGQDAQPDAEEFEARPIRVPHPPRQPEPAPAPDPVSEPASLGHLEIPGGWTPPTRPDRPSPPAEADHSASTTQAAQPLSSEPHRPEPRQPDPAAPAGHAAPVPAAGHEPATTAHPAPEGRPDPLPPLDLEETEPSRWRRVLVTGFAIAALVGALVGTWYLMYYR